MNHLAKIFFLITLSLGLMTCWRSPLVEGVAKASEGLGEEDKEDNTIFASIALANLFGSNSGANTNAACGMDLIGSLVYECEVNGQLDICKANLADTECWVAGSGSLKSKNLIEAEYSYYATIRDDMAPQYITEIDRILFVSSRGASIHELYVMNTDGTGVVKVDTGNGTTGIYKKKYHNGAIYTQCWYGNAMSQAGGLCSYQYPSSSRQLLLESVLGGSWQRRYSLFLSNDSDLLFTIERQSSPTAEGIRWFRLSDQSTARIDAPVYSSSYSHLQLSDGSIVVIENRSPDYYLTKWSPDTKNFTRFNITTPENGYWLSAPFASPDGKSFIYRNSYPPQAGFYMADESGTIIKRLSGAENFGRLVAWHPDGRYLLFRSSTDYRVYDLQNESSVRLQLTPIPESTSLDTSLIWIQ